LNVLLLMQRIGVFTLFFPMLFLPMIHVHPASEHVQGEVHQARVHADFFPNATHGPEAYKKNLGDIASEIVFSHDAFSEIDLLSPHIPQSFQFSSILKKQLTALAQNSLESSILLYFQKEISQHQYIPPPQIPQFSPPSLRGPPFFA